MKLLIVGLLVVTGLSAPPLTSALPGAAFPERSLSGRVLPGRVPSGRVPSGRVPSGRVLPATMVAAAQTFTGTITDSMCDNADHAPMRMGPTDAECAEACVSIHDADYVLSSGKEVYVLSDKPKAKQFVAQKVTVTGTLDAKTKTIQVDSITAAH